MMAAVGSVEWTRATVEAASIRLAELIIDNGPDDPRVKDARESYAGWVRELERLEHEEDAA